MPTFKQIIGIWLPPLAGIGLIALFVSLAMWQLDRAAEKKNLSALFSNSAAAAPLADIDDPRLYQPVTATGRYRNDQQVLIDNIIRKGQVGYFVITPFVTELDRRLLLVNRGWVSKEAYGDGLPVVSVGTEARQIAARVGRLPRVALRSGAAFSESESWPRIAVYPRLEDVAQALGEPIEEPVLLLSGDQPDGFVRDWQPRQKGPMMHYGYAFQWSALALTVLIILVWQTRKRMQK